MSTADTGTRLQVGEEKERERTVRLQSPRPGGMVHHEARNIEEKEVQRNVGIPKNAEKNSEYKKAAYRKKTKQADGQQR